MTLSPPPARVAVAAPHPAALDAAARAIADGGDAIDAALAAATALTVVYPHQCGLGGDLIALVRRPGEDVVAVVSAGAAPAGIDVAALAREERMPRQGAQTVTIPGAVAGWRAIAGLGGRLGLDTPLRRAAELAAEGVPVSAGLGRAIALRREELLADEGMRGVFGDGAGGLLGEGDLLVQPALAASLAELVDDPGAFYRGRIADSLAARLAALGGAHTPADFAAHEAELVEPAVSREGGVRWWVAPPPSQGVVLLGVLPEALSGDTAALVGAVRDAALVRQAELGDPRGGAIDVEAMLDPRRLSRGALPRAGRALGDTVAVTAADTDGTVVTLIQSVYQLFGSGILDPGTGIVLHNRGSAFSTDPAHPGRVGPGLRPPHTLLPVIAERAGSADRSGSAADAGLVLGLGCQGGSAQPWILAQLVRDLLDPAADPAAVLERPRFVVGARDLGHEELTLVAEPGVPDAVAAAEALGLPVAAVSGPVDEAGHVQLVRLHADGRLDAASDPRADGRALVAGAG
ncbi:gamma-glutamyltransferase [Rathayibacter sp. VKM Ac-2856]|uniref:gamma-glutamyltransferase n=1 Tax=unclassified Rathayibacter TaxID=2609250 RepID=UPI0015660799|nr:MULTISPECIES: gamma-glutamyltransferase [unclassified Rathayibacter]NQX06117.1 gamma-glutamyltransferase [Rathayibacter sp. VKM Ac-2858]NQX20933.1 gamma-glutamyltransferase [Rathayibacter sp. VKM Ac-2856]